MQTLTLTDIATGWTECAPLLVREQKLLTEVLSAMQERMPFALLGFDTRPDFAKIKEEVCLVYIDEMKQMLISQLRKEGKISINLP